MSEPAHGDNLLVAIRREGLDTLDGAMAYRYGEDKVKSGLAHRRRTHFTLRDDAGGEHELFIKRYQREPLWWSLRRWWTYGRRKSPAGVEFENVRAAREAGIRTMREVVFGEEFGLFGAARSYIVVTAVEGESLERCGELLLAREGGPAELTRKLAELVRTLHSAGFVHRDLYAGHIFADEQSGALELSLIDLARMFRPRCFARRWRVKDLAQLKYSMPPEWIHSRWEEFLALYLGGDPAKAARWNRAVDSKVRSMRRIHQRRVRRMMARRNSANSAGKGTTA